MLIKAKPVEKTLFKDGLPLSPKAVTKDSPTVKEGFTRLQNACRVHKIKCSEIDNFLFGKNYQLEVKITIRSLKQVFIAKLRMEESAAQEFATYLVDPEGNSTKDGVVDESKGSQGYKVLSTLQSNLLSSKLVSFDDEKMKLVIGEKLQDSQTLAKVSRLLDSCEDENFNFERVA